MHVRRKLITASVQSDTIDLIADVRQKGSELIRIRSEIDSCGLPVDINDSDKITSFMNEVLSLDPAMLSDNNPSVTASTLKAICACASTVMSRMLDVDSSGLVYVDMSVAALKSINDLDRMIIGFHNEYDCPLYEMISECRSFCSTVVMHEPEIMAIISVWDPSILLKDEGLDVAGSWVKANNAGFLSKKKAKAEFMSKVSPYLRNSTVEFDSLSTTASLIGEIGPAIRRTCKIPSKYSNNPKVITYIHNMYEKSEKAEKVASVLTTYGLSPNNMKDVYSKAQKA